MIKREITPHLKSLAEQFPVVAVMGPRQSGKTTLAKQTFPDYAYVTLEDLDKRNWAKEDPRGFFATFTNQTGLIIDEIQEVPELFSYMQGIVDQEYRPGFFIVTGSQHFLMYEKISQTLAGRIALLTLLPLSVRELKDAKLVPPDATDFLLKGGYPRLYDQPISVETWCANYISTYVEKDVRQVLQVSDIMAFQRFLKLCAARVGNLLNYASLARDADISPNTAKAWLSILEASYIIKLLSPYYKNFNKRIIKSPKIYFYDTALVCSLLGIKNSSELRLHIYRGAIFETFVISETLKYNYNNNVVPNIHFWRDVQGHEIDLLVEKGVHEVIPVEVKSGMTITPDFFSALRDWKDITQQKNVQPYVVYGGTENILHKDGNVFAWDNVATMLERIYMR